MAAWGANNMVRHIVRPLLAAAVALLVLPTPSFAGKVSGGRSVSISRSISYSPARPSYSGAAAKPSSTTRPSTSAPAAATGATRPQAAVASVSGASAPVRQESSSGSFWTPFVLGYMMAPSASHAAPSSTKATTPPSAAAVAPAVASGTTVPAQAAPAADPKARTGPFAIDVPENELFDGDCKIRPAAQEFIKAAKIDHSVLFLAAPESGRCGKIRDRLAGQVAPAILVKSENDHIVLSRMMKQ